MFFLDGKIGIWNIPVGGKGMICEWITLEGDESHPSVMKRRV
jgi:hypothetical protein